MTSEKRQFSDFTKFPGKIDNTTGSYIFPSLYHTDDVNNTRIWTVNIRLIKGPEKKYKFDWDVMLDNTIPIKPSYLKEDNIPEGTSVQLWIETGVIGGKISRHTPTYPKEKNIGKINFRNKFHQALVLARSQYLKKIENGMCLNLTDKVVKVARYFPMLVRKYEDEKSNLIYPLFVQPKLDGARVMIFLDKTPEHNPTFENVNLYRRQRKDYNGFDELKKELLPGLIKFWDYEHKQSIYIDGEFYKHGMDLQTISGAVRNPDRDKIPTYNGIKLNIFDAFYPKRLNVEYVNRIDYVNKLFDYMGDTKCIDKVETTLVHTEKEQESLYEKYLSKKYEGIIIRNSNSLYLTSSSKNSMALRSKYVLKRKMVMTDEFETVDFTQGDNGRDKNAIIWICKTPTTNKLFNVIPKNTTYEERYKLYSLACSGNRKGFNDNFKGRLLIVEYEDLSNDMVPLRAKSIGFREHI